MKFISSSDFKVESLGKRKISVYDIETSDNHNFFANNILIHNSIYVNTEPLVPAMLTMYRPIIEYCLNLKNPDIVKELEKNNFWNNIVDEFINKSDLVKKYFKPHDVLEGNGLVDKFIKVEISTEDNKKLKTYCEENNIPFVFRRRGDNKTVHYFFHSDDVSEIISKLSNCDVKIISNIRTFVIDDFANTVIQDIIDNNYRGISEYLNAKNKMVMKRESVCINGFWVGKKNYVLNVIDNEGVSYATPETKITGIVKSSLPSKIRPMVKDFITLLLAQKDRKSKESLEILNNYIVECTEKFMSLHPSEVGLNVQVNNVESAMSSTGFPVKGASINSVGAIYFNRFIRENNLSEFQKINEGDKMKYVYLTEPNPWGIHVMGFKDEGLPEAFWNYVDMNTMLDKAFYDILNIILSASGIELSFQRECDNIMSWLD